MAIEIEPEHFERNKQLLLECNYSDLRIECQDCKFKVHRSMLCYRKNFFEVAVKDGFKEPNDMLIKLPEDDPYVVAKVLRYLYTSGYFCDDEEIDTWEEQFVSLTREDRLSNPRYNSMLLHAMVYTLAGKCLIGPLQDQSFEFLREELVEVDYDFWDFSSAVQHVYEKESESRLKELFVFAAQRSVENDGITEEDFQDIAVKTPEFGLAMYLTGLQNQLKVTCQECERTNDLKASGCSCGFRGFCSDDCRGRPWKELKCSGCGAFNKLVLEEDQNVWVGGKLVSVATAQKEYGWHIK